MTNALIVVDLQNDFVSGSLAVPGAGETANRIGALLNHDADRYDVVVATQDWHIDPGPHFSQTPDYIDTWPAHCVAGTIGADVHPAVGGLAFDAAFRKGHHSAAYSGFEGRSTEDETGLADWLHTCGVTTVDIVGIATDYCVKATALDAVKAGFITRVLLDLTAAVSAETRVEAVLEMAGAGVKLVA